jgi:hypothetical protein
VISVTVGDSGSPSNSITRSFTVYIRASNNGNPTIAGLSDVSINEDTPLTIPFTVNDEGGTSALSLSAASSNTNLLTTNALVFGGSGSSRTLTITPSLNQFGTSIVTVAVSDTGFGYVATNFVLTVNSVNDLPVISPISPQTISEDGVLSSLAFTVSDAETPAGALNVTANSSNLGLVPLSNIALGGTGTNRAITITPVAQQSGASTITLTVTDGNGAATNTTFVLNVTSQNDAPTISDIPNQTINEDSTTGLIAFTIGDTETAAASLQVGVSSSNPALVPTNNIVLAGSGSSRTVMLTPLPDQFGVSTISVTVTDGALTATDTFLLTVNSQNDAPTLNAISNLTIDKDSGQQTVNLSGISFGPANESQTLAVSVDSSNPAIVPRPSVSYTSPATTGTLAFTPVAGTNGTATITVTVSDGQSVNGSVTRTFTVTVREGQPPAVAIARSGPNVIVSWPAVGSFTLQSITAVPPVGTWSDAGITPTLVGTNYTATLPANTSQKFYRLRN